MTLYMKLATAKGSDLHSELGMIAIDIMLVFVCGVRVGQGAGTGGRDRGQGQRPKGRK